MARTNPSAGTNQRPAAAADDFQKGIPYAKADPYGNDPYPGPPEATRRKSVVIKNSDGSTTKITGGLQRVEPQPISDDEFNQMAKGGSVRTKGWERALSEHQQRRASSRAASQPKAKKSKW